MQGEDLQAIVPVKTQYGLSESIDQYRCNNYPDTDQDPAPSIYTSGVIS